MMMDTKQRRACKQYVQIVYPAISFGNVRHRIWDECKLETFDSFGPRSIHILPLKARVENLT